MKCGQGLSEAGDGAETGAGCWAGAEAEAGVGTGCDFGRWC